MHVKINGKPQEIQGDMAPLTAILDWLGMDIQTPGIAIALNLNVVPRIDWSKTQVEDGDEIEIITARQGG